ncbi:MAG: kinase/pyrophosphorylase, partial [Planctomycetes bacterium]|nr:kinase/pyrophosphorylase [Planctomycetota bacterium]
TRRRKGLIAYTLVSSTLRGEVASRANEAGVESVDLIGPLITSLSSFLTASPAQRPGIFTQPGGEHYERLEAVSFTVRHDDGLAIDEVALADIVITGPSRTAKTPISVYLAHTRGLRVANVPLAVGVDPPEELRRLPPGRVIGLTLSATVLAEIRRQRLRDMGSPEIEYAQLAFVEKELRHCHEVYRRPPPWPIVDVTSKSIEEIAGEICSLTTAARRAAGGEQETGSA